MTNEAIKRDSYYKPSGVDLILDSLRFLQFTDKEYLITFSLKILGVTPHC